MSSLVPSLQGEEDTGGRENKGQFITGIQEHSLLGLRSHVAQKQSEARGAAPSRRTRPAANSLLLQFRKTPAHGEHRGHLASLLQRKNKGIDSRMKRDVAGSGPSRGEEVSEEERLAILEDKAKRYESLLFQTQAPSPSSQGGAGTESSKPTLGASKRDLRVQVCCIPSLRT